MRKLIFIALTSTLLVPVMAWAKDDCEEVETPKYIGAMCDGEYEGFGQLFNDEGRKIYEGEFSEGKFHGPGTILYTDGRLETTFRNGEAHGPGKVILSNGHVQFEGSYKKGRKDGPGKAFFTDGSSYVGEYKRGLYHGQGELKFTTKEGEAFTYKGEFKNNEPDGQGIKTIGQYRHEGGFKRGLKNGYGKFTGPKPTQADIIEKYGEDYEKYNPDLTQIAPVAFEGEYKMGNMHGQGSVTYSNGDTYQGLFEDKQPKEDGKHFDENGNPSNRHLISIKSALPKMPHRAEKSGHCVVNFDINAKGEPDNIFIESCSEKLFEKNSVKNIKKARFYPKMENGVAVPRKNWRKKVHFVLYDENWRYIPE